MCAVIPGPGSTRDLLWSQLGDEMLGRRAAAGNDAAFTALYERYHDRLLNYCRSILLNAEDAHDATQSALENALRALPQRDPGRPLRPWLYRIAHNEAVTILRRRQSHDELGPDTEAAVAPYASPEVYTEQRGRLEQLVEDLRGLPERQRGALVMRELSGLSYDEIGLALELSPANARRAVFDARSALLDVEGGRDADCVSIRQALSDGDRRSMRARRIRAHLRSCDACSSFNAGIGARRADLPAIAPWISGAAVASALGIGLGSTVTGGGVLAGGLTFFPGVAKTAAVMAVIATTSTAAVEINRAVKPERPDSGAQTASVAPRHAANDEARAARTEAAKQAARTAALRAAAAERKRMRGGSRVPVSPATGHTTSALKSAKPSASTAKPKIGAPPSKSTSPPPPPTPPAASVSKPPPKVPTPSQLLAQKLKEIQDKILAALAGAQQTAAAGTSGALQNASAMIANTLTSVQNLVKSVLGSFGVPVPTSVASAPKPPSNPSSLSGVLAPVQQVLSGVTNLLATLFKRD